MWGEVLASGPGYTGLEGPCLLLALELPHVLAGSHFLQTLCLGSAEEPLGHWLPHSWPQFLLGLP
jgi:hypothetical protein